MSNSDSLAGCRLFVGTDVLVRARLGEEEAQAASPLLVLLPVDGEFEENIRIPASLLCHILSAKVTFSKEV